MVEYKAPRAAMEEAIPRLRNYALYLHDVLSESEQENGNLRAAWQGEAGDARHTEHTAWLDEARAAQQEVMDRHDHLKLAHETYTKARNVNGGMFEL